jgi:hypothetical protein
MPQLGNSVAKNLKGSAAEAADLGQRRWLPIIALDDRLKR